MNNKKSLKLIAAYSGKKYGIGFRNGLPWNNKIDMKHFKNITTSQMRTKQNALIMGWNTFNSLPNGKPLPNRKNIIIDTRGNTISDNNDIVYVKNIQDALLYCYNNNNIQDIFICGGANTYENLLGYQYVDIDDIYFTEIIRKYGEYRCDTFFPMNRVNFDDFYVVEKKVYDMDDNTTVITHYKNYKNHPEVQYLNALEHILCKGEERRTRNAITYSTFDDCEFNFDLRDGTLPVLTTKRMYWRGIIEELLFFIRGHTDSKLLEAKKVNIWKFNTEKSFLHRLKFYNYPEGDMGPMYGFNWRHFGAEYKTCKEDYTNQGIDQLGLLVEEIINNPTSRRLLLTTYDPKTVNKCVLYPCHGLTVQFYVNDNKELSCYAIQRSADMFLGVPFNITSYSVLLVLLSKITNTTPGSLTIKLGDSHIYKDHIEQVKENIKRKPHKFPKLKINNLDNVQGRDGIRAIEKLTFEDFVLEDYQHHPAIKAQMVA